MDNNKNMIPATVLHWNYRGFTEFPLSQLKGEESEVTDIYLKENLISKVPSGISVLEHLESLYLSGNDITELPREISKLRCLKCLDVSGNRLRRVPDEIGEARSLKFLILDENELTELPLRIGELRGLRYLSVCDNKLQWLPQRPVYNYHHCEFRFWRNPTLRSLPYSLWYHMFRGQQTRSLNIGCFNVGYTHSINKGVTCKLKLSLDTTDSEILITCPQYTAISDSKSNSPPSLYEICKRQFYEILSNTTKLLNTQIETYNYHSNVIEENSNGNNNIIDLQENFEDIKIGNELERPAYDENGNRYNNTLIEENYVKPKKMHFVAAEIISDYFSFLPKFLRTELSNGPISRCENLSCKKPAFDHVYHEFCFGQLKLIDKIEEVLLNAVFCSKSCAESWKKGKITMPWTLA